MANVSRIISSHLAQLPHPQPFEIQTFKLSAMDVLARTTMKDAANCDTQCELQNSVNHQTAERKRRRQGFFLAARLFQCFCIVSHNGIARPLSRPV